MVKNVSALVALACGIASLWFEFFSRLPSAVDLKHGADILIIVISLSDFAISFFRASYKKIYFRNNIFYIAFLFIYLTLFIVDTTMSNFLSEASLFSALAAIIVLRNIMFLLKVFSRFGAYDSFTKSIAENPAATILLSFFFLIVTGAIFLSMPFVTADGKSLSFIDAVFTSASAVCVTGLIVVDTATAFSFWGKLVILILIQAGGLGIMILSFSAVFMFKKTVSLENKVFVSYMLSEEDMGRISSVVRNITVITVLIEMIGAFFLFIFMKNPSQTSVGDRIFYSVFHSISAFCNAGFALFSDNLEQFYTNPGVVFTIAFLIILGGISFIVMTDMVSVINGKLKSAATGKYRKNQLSVNTRLVLTWTAGLILIGMFVIYFFEHGNTIKTQNIAIQYLSSFFQSVTLRTAGFNTISFSSLMPVTLFFMIILMFIGGASGSTAGGIKVNTVALISAYFRSFFRNDKDIIIYQREISREIVLKAFSVLALAVLFLSAGFFILLVVEDKPPLELLFEGVSAFCTVGLSTGITGHLSTAGKAIIIILMFAGRVGPLTIVSSMGKEKKRGALQKYPASDIPIG